MLNQSEDALRTKYRQYLALKEKKRDKVTALSFPAFVYFTAIRSVQGFVFAHTSLAHHIMRVPPLPSAPLASDHLDAGRFVRFGPGLGLCSRLDASRCFTLLTQAASLHNQQLAAATAEAAASGKGSLFDGLGYALGLTSTLPEDFIEETDQTDDDVDGTGDVATGETGSGTHRRRYSDPPEPPPGGLAIHSGAGAGAGAGGVSGAAGGSPIPASLQPAAGAAAGASASGALTTPTRARPAGEGLVRRGGAGAGAPGSPLAGHAPSAALPASLSGAAGAAAGAQRASDVLASPRSPGSSSSATSTSSASSASSSSSSSATLSRTLGGGGAGRRGSSSSGAGGGNTVGLTASGAAGVTYPLFKRYVDALQRIQHPDHDWAYREAFQLDNTELLVVVRAGAFDVAGFVPVAGKLGPYFAAQG